jgi:hypothetical protein
MKYRYEVNGTAAQGQTWTCSGYIGDVQAGQFPEVQFIAMKLAFTQLTQGLAVYGKPGVGCEGPYAVTKLLIELEEE